MLSARPGVSTKSHMPSVNQTPPVSKTANQSLASLFAWLFVIGLSYVLLLSVLAGPHFFGHHIKAGDIAEQDMVATAKALVIDEDKTQELKDIARHDVLPVFARNKHKSSEVLKNIDTELARLKCLLADSVLPLPQPPSLSAEEQSFLIEISADNFDKLTAALNSENPSCPLTGSLAHSVFNKLETLPQKQAISADKSKGRYNRGARNKSNSEKNSKNINAESFPLSKEQYISQLAAGRQKYQAYKSSRSNIEHKLLLLAASLKPEDAQTFCTDTSASVSRLLTNVSLQPYVDRHEWEVQVFEFLPARLGQTARRLCADFVAAQLQSNVSVDQTTTEEKIKEAAACVKPVMKEIDLGAVIVKKGDTFKAEDVKLLESIGVTKVSDPGLSAAIAIALFAAFLLLGTYLHMYEPKLFFSPSALALMSTLAIATCFSAFVIGNRFPQFVPLSATSLILAVTYGKRLTGTYTVLLVLFLYVSELMTGPNLVALATAAGMAIGTGFKRRRDLVVTGIVVGSMQMIGYTVAVIFVGSAQQTANFGRDLPLEVMGGLFCAVLAIGSLPFLENIFGLLTPYRIAELAEPDQPLMRQLEENAPGTYQHSLAVANLAEGGARAIGANVNLVHTGAMYHDIGKMVTPRYFIENQLGDKNPHDFIPPEESRAKVFAHVTNGQALAQKYGLPKPVQAFIPEHQGTTVMAYFYHKACLRDGVENVDKNSYRYPGPKPQTRESAVVMLADVSEAVTHSMHDPTMEEVETAISTVFKAFWLDGQFIESGLTIDDMEKIKRGFVRVWRTLHHDRLKYPSTTTGQMPLAPQTLSPDLNNLPRQEEPSAAQAVAPTRETLQQAFYEPDC